MTSSPPLNKNIRRSDWRSTEAKWFNTAHLRREVRIQCEEGLVIFLDNGIVSSAAAEQTLLPLWEALPAHRQSSPHQSDETGLIIYITLLSDDASLCGSPINIDFPHCSKEKSAYSAHTDRYNPSWLSAVVVFPLSQDKHLSRRAFIAMDLVGEITVYLKCINPVHRLNVFWVQFLVEIKETAPKCNFSPPQLLIKFFFDLQIIQYLLSLSKNVFICVVFTVLIFKSIKSLNHFTVKKWIGKKLSRNQASLFNYLLFSPITSVFYLYVIDREYYI